jgi:hypothetical protein
MASSSGLPTVLHMLEANGSVVIPALWPCKRGRTELNIPAVDADRTKPQSNRTSTPAAMVVPGAYPSQTLIASKRRLHGSHPFRCLNLLPQCGQRLGQEPRHVHLRYPEPFGDLGLRQVLEESKLQNHQLAFWQRRQEWADGFDVEHLIEICVEISEAVSRASSSVVVASSRRRVRRKSRIRAKRNLRLHHLFAVNFQMGGNLAGCGRTA